MDDIVQGYPSVGLSITNPDVSKDKALDRNEPFTFLEFVNATKEIYQPDTLEKFYNHYIKEWNKENKGKRGEDNEIIIERYREFLRDITLNYSTNAERTFLSQIDFNDRNDLQIAISFYSKKIRSVIGYYKEKRDDLYFTNVKHKLKGSNLGAQQAAYDLVIDYLENRSTANIDYDIELIKKNLSISLTEFFDNYSQYFNQTPDDQDYGKNFKEYNPDGPPQSNLFLAGDQQLIDEVFKGVSEDIRQLKQAGELFKNKRAQTKKFMGADFWYLSTDGTGIPEIGILFEADKPYANFLNQDYPSTASVFSNDITSERNQGFFKPTNTSINSIESKRLEFFSRDKYEPNQLFIFPDPNIFTNNQDIIAFVVDTSKSINNTSKGIAANQPNTTKSSSTFIGYNSYIPGERNLNTDLSFLYDEGYITDGKKDLYGNIFGLLKDEDYYRSNVTVETQTNIKNLILNGYQFFDDMYGEGYNFNYDTTDSSTFAQQTRSGLTSFTNSMTGYSVSAYNIFFRYFDPYQRLIDPNPLSGVDYTTTETMSSYNAEVVAEGAYFKFNNSESLADPIRSGLSAYTASTDQFYFSDLVDAGISDIAGATVVRALCDATYPAASGNFTFNARLSGNNNVLDYDGLFFDNEINYEYTPGLETYTYDDTVFSPTQFSTVDTATENYFNKEDHLGKIYIKNINKPPGSNVNELVKTFDYLHAKYNAAIVHNLSAAVNNFDIFYNTLFIETSSYLVVEQPSYTDNEFVSPNSFPIKITHSTDEFNKVSNRFKVGDNVFYIKLIKEFISSEWETTSGQKNVRVYPEIYKYNYADNLNEKIFPTNTNTVSNLATFFDLTGSDNVYVEASKPHLTYSSENEQFSLGFILKDLNKGPVLLSYRFEYTDKINFLKTIYYPCNYNTFTYTFIKNTGAVNFSNLTMPLSSSTPTLSAITSLSATALVL